MFVFVFTVYPLRVGYLFLTDEVWITTKKVNIWKKWMKTEKKRNSVCNNQIFTKDEKRTRERLKIKIVFFLLFDANSNIFRVVLM